MIRAIKQISILVLGVSALPLFLCSPAKGAGDVVISQVWGKGIAAPANLPQASYVELFNRTSQAIDMNGWSVHIASPTSASWTKLDLDANFVNTIIQPHSYYLVQTSGGSLSIGVDAVFSPTNNILGATGGPVGNKVALRNTTGAITVSCPSGDPTIVDLVGFGGNANCFETSLAPGISTSGSGAAPTRNQGGCVDTDNNGTDFAAVPPNPRSSFSPPNVCSVSGACCNALSGACSVDSPSGCAAAGRTYIGDNTSCSPSPCAPVGRCCTALPGVCYTVTQAGCLTVNGSQWTAGVACSAQPQVCGFTDFPISTTACCFADGTCCQIDERVRTCASMGGVAPGGPTCNPTSGWVCSSTPPVNDQCAGAITLSLGVATVGSSARALANDFCQNLCNNSSYSTHGVWFKFTPAVSGQYDVSSCGSLFDTELQILRVAGSCADPSTWSYVACMLDGCPSGFPETGACGSNGLAVNARITGVRMIAGQTYHILLTGPGASTGQGSSGNFKVVVSLSSATAFGACCNTVTGQCELRSPSGCAGSVPSSMYLGDGTSCTPGLCSIGAAACCNFGGCTLRTPTFCQQIGGTLIGDVCLPSPCITGACCTQAGSCLAPYSFSQCYNNNGTYLGDNATCSAVSCPQPGACCYPSGLCSFLSESACTHPTSVNSIPGTFLGVGLVCDGGNCPQLGACCSGSTCSAVTESACTGPNTRFAGVGTICNVFMMNNTSPCCFADYNQSGVASVQDVFDFLFGYFTGAAQADINRVSGVSVQDIFDFLATYFAGC